MSFARTVKKELSTLPVSFDEMLAEFAAFLNLTSEFHIENKVHMLDFKTNNPAIARRFLQTTKSLYDVETTLLTKEQTKLYKKQSIIVRITNNVLDIVKEHKHLEDPIGSQKLLTSEPILKRAFLRAAFLVAGSVNHPNKSEYHLEIYTTNKEQIIFIQQLMNSFDLNAKITIRRKGYIVYLKEAQSISDMLQLMGATNAVFMFEDLRIKRDFNNSINRIINIELANEKKAVSAANDQINDIEIIEKYLFEHNVDNRLQKVMDLRKKHPLSSLSELQQIYEEEYDEKISKSGIYHRFEKIKQMAIEIRKGRE